MVKLWQKFSNNAATYNYVIFLILSLILIWGFIDLVIYTWMFLNDKIKSQNKELMYSNDNYGSNESTFQKNTDLRASDVDVALKPPNDMDSDDSRTSVSSFSYDMYGTSYVKKKKCCYCNHRKCWNFITMKYLFDSKNYGDKYIRVQKNYVSTPIMEVRNRKHKQLRIFKWSHIFRALFMIFAIGDVVAQYLTSNLSDNGIYLFSCN